MSYAVYFDKNNETLRLPVNPEEIKITKSQKIETYEVLNLGQVALSGGPELQKYSFEAELPGRPYGYVQTLGGFKPASFYIEKFKEWIAAKEPVKMAINEKIKDADSLWVLIESFDITEKSGEEGDYYAQFSLTEYRNFGKTEIHLDPTKINGDSVKTKTGEADRKGTAPKPKTYTVVKGDTLWGIAKRFLGSGAKYPNIVKINPAIKNPSLIKIGQVIKLP
jgi:hypothetical protein